MDCFSNYSGYIYCHCCFGFGIVLCRAKAVYEYLFQKGITFNRIEYAGFGEDRPIATNDSEEGRQINRRVEFVVLELEEENVDVKY